MMMSAADLNLSLEDAPPPNPIKQNIPCVSCFGGCGSATGFSDVTLTFDLD